MEIARLPDRQENEIECNVPGCSNVFVKVECHLYNFIASEQGTDGRHASGNFQKQNLFT